MNYEEHIDRNDIALLKMANFDEIELWSRSQDKESILLFFGITSMDKLNEIEHKWFDIAFHRGRMKAAQEATESLFNSMKDSKSGAAACLSYLKRFANDWKGDIDDSEGKGGTVSYQVNLRVPEAD